MALGVTDDNNGLETGTLTGTGLLLDGFDLEDDIMLVVGRFPYPKLRKPVFISQRSSV